MPAASDTKAFPLKSAGVGEARKFIGRINIGAAGAVTTLDNLPGFTAANGGAGIFNVTCPTGFDLHVLPGVKSAARTVVAAYLKAQSASAGTFQLETIAPGGAATNPASGDFVTVEVTFIKGGT